MKKSITVLLLIVVFAASFCACTGKRMEWSDSNNKATENEVSDVELNDVSGEINIPAEPLAYAFEAQYIRTDGVHDESKYPIYVLIDSHKELEDYYETNKDVFDLERRDTVYSDTSIGFLDACDKYDETYFEDNNILLIILAEPSGSIRHNVSEVRLSREKVDYLVSIERIVPEVYTDDMATWHIFIEVEMGRIIHPGNTVGIDIYEK